MKRDIFRCVSFPVCRDERNRHSGKPDGQTCLARWDGASSVFVDSCDPTTTWPPDGHGLAQLDWQVVDGELRVAVSGTRPADWEARP